MIDPDHAHILSITLLPNPGKRKKRKIHPA
jgi:hypothetical protein